MKKELVTILVCGLLLLGTTPTLAAEQRPSAAVLGRGEAVNIVLPEGVVLDSEDLDDVQGALGPLGWFAVRGLVGAAIGATVAAIDSYRRKGYVDARDTAAGALAGMVTAYGGKILNKIP
ncbi:hypothetical protein [Marinithermus hydrothermalis]|uniref:Uncharacterized protein n=1 Tax=Marinithermus hydrothermalis (strain DSM 14884 / JCM 11576 / T1) TaxID=869210 RepID=F2NN27_MARHT|nr:hypothetical protein [Marinithermus hydrothermalis]AEB12766.1 hypothetical protein Marky_2039 [Marinithermus hydrothermalis DSM 14884]